MDDFSPRPTAPQLNVDDVMEEIINEDAAVLASYFHPAWSEIEKMFLEEIESRKDINSISTSLSSEEYKAMGVANAAVVQFLSVVLDRVKEAVNAQERRKKSGAK